MARKLTSPDDTKPVGGNEALSKEVVSDAIKGSRGVLAQVARNLKVTRQTVYNAIKRYPELEDELRDEKEGLNDDVELTIVDQMLGGWQIDPVSKKKVYRYPDKLLLQFWARTQMKNRGYSEKIELGLSPDIVALLPQLQQAAKAAGVELAELLQSNIEALKEGGE